MLMAMNAKMDFRNVMFRAYPKTPERLNVM